MFHEHGKKIVKMLEQKSPKANEGGLVRPSSEHEGFYAQHFGEIRPCFVKHSG
jgi:hypothetical protein